MNTLPVPGTCWAAPRMAVWRARWSSWCIRFSASQAPMICPAPKILPSDGSLARIRHSWAKTPPVRTSRMGWNTLNSQLSARAVRTHSCSACSTSLFSGSENSSAPIACSADVAPAGAKAARTQARV
jgi:hypothetical protein